MRLTVTMPGPRLYVARAEPYRLSDLESWLETIKRSPLVEVTSIGKTAEGRGLEIVRVGRENAPYRVFLRARAHPWEPGGNWVAQEQNGLYGGLFVNRAQAVKYALFENGHHPETIVELSGETAHLPASVLEKGEVVFRARGDKMRDQGIEDGDLLIVELRQTGRAASGELVIGKVGEQLYVGHWWQKHGHKAIMSDGPAELTTGGTSKRTLKVLAAINAIVRPTTK